jgi:hypothetical protein
MHHFSFISDALSSCENRATPQRRDGPEVQRPALPFSQGSARRKPAAVSIVSHFRMRHTNVPVVASAVCPAGEERYIGDTMSFATVSTRQMLSFSKEDTISFMNDLHTDFVSRDPREGWLPPSLLLGQILWRYMDRAYR